MNNIINIINQFFKGNRSQILLSKISNRFSNLISVDKTDLAWLNDNQSDLDDFLININLDLWQESKNIHKEINDRANKILPVLNVKLGGGASDKLLYFLVRLKKPNTIIETGVAAGFSSLSILKAIEFNKKGKLYSSDFPYFRLKEPEKYIGALVDRDIYKNWELEIEGDSVNIPRFLNSIEKIDLFHYDSDKSYGGKTKTFELVRPKLSINSVVIFDDIQDDNFFKNLVVKNNNQFKIFKVDEKFIGLIESIK